ncbi:hypothetical protein HYALB_00000129 [Hymenoscyphus albidus]|uniref:Uncharacterized protein n=1 Tax=Hymenoscyphus albidus TaxID=595503 RepID=A0A9N9Q4L6_9HELO|nr:hypothetical protein HYALB_00000129 [Hymenoscyphus albidus]
MAMEEPIEGRSSFQLYNEEDLPTSHTVEVAESVAAMKVAMKGRQPDPKRCIIFESGSGPIWKVLKT